MSFPNISEYNKSILEHNGFAFRTLRGLNFVPSRSHPIKIYTFGSGSFAVTFRASDGNKDFAIRCFNVPNYEIINRYSSIVSHLNQVNESWKVDIEYYNDEILVGNSYFPIIKMDWVSGLQLNEFIGRHLSNNNILTTIQEKLVELSESLERSQVGHGDLQSSNLIVWESNEDITLKLIDYDGMYVPAFRGRTILKSIFLHPNFDNIEFNERIDRFSIWLLLTAIEALKYDKALWNSPLENGFNNGDNILFEPGMLADFARTGLYIRLKDLNISSLNLYLNKLVTYSNLSFDPNNVDKPEIFKSDDIVEHSPTKPISPISLPVLIIPPPLSTPRSITINSNPEGLPVFIDNNVHAQIGVTPLNYSYDQLKNKTIYIKQGKESKQFTFNNYPNDISLVFDVESDNKDNMWLGFVSLVLLLFIVLSIIILRTKNKIGVDAESIKSTEIENVSEIPIENKTYHVDSSINIEVRSNIEILKSKIGRTPKLIDSFSINGQNFLVGVFFTEEMLAEGEIYIYKNINNNWDLKLNQKLLGYITFGKISKFESEDNKIYFEYFCAGGNAGNGSRFFNVFDIESNKFYTLEFTWDDWKYFGAKFENEKTINNIKLLRFLKSKALKSEEYRDSQIKSDWEIANSNIYKDILKSDVKIAFIQYDSSQFLFEIKHGRSLEFNDIIVSYGNHLVVYNKNTGKSFLIWESKSGEGEVRDIVYEYGIIDFIYHDWGSVIGEENADIGIRIRIDLDSKVGSRGVYGRF